MDLIADIKDVVFFQDFLAFLRYLERQPISKTVKGNISRKDIVSLADTMKCIKDRIAEYSKYDWKIVGEWQLKDIDKIKKIAEVMFLTYNRKEKLLLSKNGRGYINHNDRLIQYKEMVLHYFERLSWDYFHPSMDTRNSIPFLDVLQASQNILWRIFLSNGTKWIEFKQFQETLINNFCIDDCIDSEDTYNGAYQADIEHGFLRPLLEFGCIDTETEVISQRLEFTRITKFRPTNLGLYIFREEVENSLYTGTCPIRDLWKK